MSLPRSLKGLSLLFLAITSVACGSYKTEKVKDYRLAVLHDDSRIKEQFDILISDFNEYAGFRVLTYVSDANDANSSVFFTQGLKARDGKVGYGQWLSETKSESPVTAVGSRPKRTVSYSMRLELDEDYVRENTAKQDRDKRYKMQKLFFHEIGHGLELDHNEADMGDLMYPDISGNKDFERFFKYVRSYMND